jgi:hypothetical protein
MQQPARSRRPLLLALFADDQGMLRFLAVTFERFSFIHAAVLANRHAGC